MSESRQAWAKSSWRSFSAQQQPSWPSADSVDVVFKRLSRLPALVFADETRALKNQLVEVAKGKAFVLQAGDCAETFSRCHGPYIHDLLKVILQIAVVLAFAGEKKIVTIGRLAGQYAKPRSESTETVDGNAIASYRGDMVNSIEPTAAARVHNPQRMLEGYFCSATTLNLVRAFAKSGYASLSCLDSLNQASFGQFHVNPEYKKLCADIQKAVNFMTAIGIKPDAAELNEFGFYTSHEALLLEYEEALTRVDTRAGNSYDTSAHMLWIGERTRQLDGAHVEFARGISNPIGVKIGPDYCLDDIKRLIDVLNPANEPGRLSLITRLGARKIDSLLPPLLEAIKREGKNIVWICDPMHGNTYLNENGRKTRDFDVIAEEVRRFFEAHRKAQTVAGGIHLELSGTNVSECVGGSSRLPTCELADACQSVCDPGLSAEQGIELAFAIARVLHKPAQYTYK